MSTIPNISSEPLILNRKKITTKVFLDKKEHGDPISMLTAYDYPTRSMIKDVG